MKIRKGDKVKVIAGKDKGAEGIVESTDAKLNKLKIDGVNMVTRSKKPSQGKEGGIVQENRPIDISNVMLIDTKSGKPTRVGFKIIDGKKYRFNKGSGEVIDNKK